MDIGTRIFSWLNGRKIGRDADGNTYFEDKRGKLGDRVKRWVVYAGQPDPTAVPPEWHAWLHHTTDAPLAGHTRSWQKPHQPNRTGTALGYRPKGHDYQGGHRAAATGDYEAWTPDAAPALPPPRA